MDRLTISPLRGLIDFWFALSYNLYISLGLKKITLKVNQENMPATFPFGLKILFDGYLIAIKFLCYGYVMEIDKHKIKSLIINDYLCDGDVIGNPILFDGYLTKVMK